MNFRPKYFSLVELVPQSVFTRWGDRSWEFLRPDALAMLDAVRLHFGPIVVNDWFTGGHFQESGLREWMTETGALWSQHKFGSAFDMKPKQATPEEVHAYILFHPEKFPMLTTLEAIEATPTWIHGDTRNHGKSGIWVVNPLKGK